MLNADSMHRLAKMALDAGEVATPEEAVALFSKYRLRLHLGAGWADTLAGQACFLTALNTAARAFLGGVEVYGDLTPTLGVPLYRGLDAATVARELGGEAVANEDTGLPTLLIGEAPLLPPSSFCVQMSWDHWRFAIGPATSPGLECTDDNPLAGVGAAALGVNEAFLHIRAELPEAGHRVVGYSLWSPSAVADWGHGAHRGPPLRFLPAQLWLVGLGHLGQAFAWTLAMLPYPEQAHAHLVLQDFDKVAESNLSTCMLTTPMDLGRSKVRVVAERLESAGFSTALVERRFGPGHRLEDKEPSTALFGVDNIDARRHLASAGFSRVVEAGLGSGHRDFRNIRVHTFPGPKNPSEIWAADAGVQSSVELGETYERLARERNDRCGMTLLASRAVATPFGSLASTLVLAEVMRPLHGGQVHAALDLQMKGLRHRTAAAPTAAAGLSTPYVQVTR